MLLFGTVGTSKTDVAAHIFLSICHQFPGTRGPVIRQNISTAVDTVIPSYLDMAHRMGLIEDKDYVYTPRPYRLNLPNGSVSSSRCRSSTRAGVAARSSAML